MTDQWPIVGRGDLYYGGTTYENKQGLGVHLTLQLLGPPPNGQAGRADCARTRTNGWRSR